MKRIAIWIPLTIGLFSLLHSGEGQSPTPNLTPQQRATKLYPDLAIATSKLNQEFVRRYRQYQKEKPAFFNDPEWPTALARECQAAGLNGGASTPAPVPEATPAPGVIAPGFTGTWKGQIDPGTGEMPGAVVTWIRSFGKSYVEVRCPQKGFFMTEEITLSRNTPITDATFTIGNVEFKIEPGANSGHFKIRQEYIPPTSMKRKLGEGTITRVSAQ
jgi:hypothetical protein